MKDTGAQKKRQGPTPLAGSPTRSRDDGLSRGDHRPPDEARISLAGRGGQSWVCETMLSETCCHMPKALSRLVKKSFNRLRDLDNLVFDRRIAVWGRLKMRLVLAALTGGAVLSGCSTVSFAPPPVPIAYADNIQASQTCDRKRPPAAPSVNRDVQGAWTVIDTFLAAYTCSRDTAANGRQAFDLPAFFSTTGAATALALGATPVTTIGVLGTAGSSVFNAGKAYYDPAAKAKIYNQALSALICIRKESAGVPAKELEKAKNTNALFGLRFAAESMTSPVISLTAEEQYFIRVTSAVFEVRDILADRLSGVGTLSGKTVADEITKAAEDARKKQEEIDKKKTEAEQNPTGTTKEKALFNVAGKPELTQALIELSRQQDVIELELEKLEPKLDQCVATAKL
jgi:hypothetical protein